MSKRAYDQQNTARGYSGVRPFSMNCPECGGSLEIDLDHLQSFCPYCGKKLMIDFDQLGRILAEKEKTKRAATAEQEQTKREATAEEEWTKRAATAEQEQTKRAQMEYAYRAYEKKQDRKQETRKSFFDSGFLWFAVLAALLLAMLIYPLNPGGKQHKKLVQSLEELSIEIETDIGNEDYDSALLKANRLRCDDHYSTEETKSWDKKREGYIEIINDKQRQSDLQNPDKIFVPAAAGAFKDLKKDEAVQQLKDRGFTDITTQKAVKSAGLFKKEGTVEHILIGGKADFTEEDYFDKDTPIIVYYYAK